MTGVTVNDNSGLITKTFVRVEALEQPVSILTMFVILIVVFPGFGTRLAGIVKVAVPSRVVIRMVWPVKTLLPVRLYVIS